MRRHCPSKKWSWSARTNSRKTESRPPSCGRSSLVRLTPRSKSVSWSVRTNKQISEEREVKPAPEGALPGGQDWGQGQGQAWGQGKSRNPAKFAPRPRHPRGAVNPRYDVPSARPLSPNHWGEGSGRWHQGDEQEMGGGAGARFREKTENQDREGRGVGKWSVRGGGTEIVVERDWKCGRKRGDRPERESKAEQTE